MTETTTYYSITETARRLGVTPYRVRRWMDAREIEFLQYPDGGRKIPREAVEQILATRERISP